MHAWWFPLYNFLQQQNFLYFTLLSSSTLHNIPKCTSAKGRVSQFFKTSSKDQWYHLPYLIGCVKIDSTYSTGEQVVEEGVWVRSTKNNGQLASQIGYHYRFLLSPFCRGTLVLFTCFSFVYMGTMDMYFAQITSDRSNPSPEPLYFFEPNSKFEQ